jgi:hypothetical protein
MGIFFAAPCQPSVGLPPEKQPPTPGKVQNKLRTNQPEQILSIKYLAVMIRLHLFVY